MTVAQKSATQARIECRKLSEQWSESERARRRKLGELRRLRLLRLLESNVKPPDYVVIGGGNANRLSDLPEGVETWPNDDAFVGGCRP